MYKKLVLGLFVFIAFVFVAGCASQQGATTQSEEVASFPPKYSRQVSPFDIRDASGQPYDMPFLGGLNVPRPQFVDIDGDGDDDLFLQEITGQLIFFEHIRENGTSRYEWRSDGFSDLGIGEWSRFYDMDNDGDFDLLTEQPFSLVKYYRNDGSAQVPDFKVLADTLLDASGEPLFADRQNIPNLTDIDCDGLVDLFIGRVEGTVMRYEAVKKVEDDPPRFRLITDRFENIEIVGQFASLHGANTLDFFDVDNDGDQDLFWGDFFEPGLLLIENTGSCSEPVLQGEPLPYPTEAPMSTSGYNAPAFSDFDGDGDQDMFVGVLGGAFNPNLTSADNFYFFERDADDIYKLTSRRFLYGLDVGRESMPVFVDLDSDGDQDLIVSNKIEPEDFDISRSLYFENEGTAKEPSFALKDTMNFEPAYHFAPAFFDLDQDGDLDALVGTWSKGIALYRNEGTATQPNLVAENTSYLKLTRGSNSTPALVDIDADGDPDLFVGEASGTVNYYNNTGAPGMPKFELVSDEYLDIDVGRRSMPVFADLDEDGDFDMIIGRESVGAVYYQNKGTPQVPQFVEDATFTFPLPSLSTPTFVDIDGDDDLDLFSGGDSGGLLFFENKNR
ncbi:MAG: FG-GAP repeat domain-containing protein [Rhodothermales bacterium]